MEQWKALKILVISHIHNYDIIINVFNLKMFSYLTLTAELPKEVPEEKVFEVFELRITLRGIKPMIWRQIQVPKDDFSFADLHDTIQEAMGWRGHHLYNFKARVSSGAFVQISDDRSTDDFLRSMVSILPADETYISEYFHDKGDSVKYLYDFGDGWDHKVTLSKILVGNPSESYSYPKLLAGKRACPPEGKKIKLSLKNLHLFLVTNFHSLDCGGPSGYAHLLEVVKDPNHEEYEDLKEWLDDYDEDFDPEKFDPKEVKGCFLSWKVNELCVLNHLSENIFLI